MYIIYIYCKYLSPPGFRSGVLILLLLNRTCTEHVVFVVTKFKALGRKTCQTFLRFILSKHAVTAVVLYVVPR